MAAPPNRDRVAHLGDFTLTPRVLRVAAWSIPVGALASVTALRAGRAAGAGRRLRRHRRAADRPGDAVARRRDPRGQDHDLVVVARLGHVGRGARAGVHDRRGARCAGGPRAARGHARVLGAHRARRGRRRRHALTADRRRLPARADARLAAGAAAADRGDVGLPRVGAAAEAVGPDREDRAAGAAPVPRVRRGPAGGAARRRGDGRRAARPRDRPHAPSGRYPPRGGTPVRGRPRGRGDRRDARDPSVVVGHVTVEHLLEGRLRDLLGERHRERILRPRLVLSR